MRFIKTLSVTLFLVALAVSAAAATAGAHAWYANGEPVEKTYSVTGAPAIGFKTTYGEEIRCSSGSRTGTVSPGGAGEVATITLSGCEQVGTVKGDDCNSNPSAKITVTAANLPWATTLTTNSEGKLVDTIKSGGHGKPTWHIKCQSVRFPNIEQTITCIGEMNPVMTNIIGGAVLAEFLKEPEQECYSNTELIRALRPIGQETIKRSGGTLQAK